jgi:diguanylate cyclase (GGDEF)-like protein/PAS domain S-box-containing protein
MADLTLPALRDLQQLILRVNGGADLAATLQAAVDGVVEGLGFGVAVVNLVQDDETVQVVAVAGSDDATEALLGATGTVTDWHRALALADEWGSLRFIPHDRFEADDESLPTWVPDVPEPRDDPDAWHPLDCLFAPLNSTAGELIGVLSVDLPQDLRKPGTVHRELLEMYAVQAAIAIDNARLTEALRTEQQRLQASEHAFRLAFESAPVGMSVIDMRDEPGRFLRVNAAMCRMLGYTRDELLTKSFADITHPDSREADTAALLRAMAGNQDIYRTENRYLRADGSRVWVSLNTSVVRDGDGAALYGITQFEDIGDRRRAHQELTRRARLDPLTGLLNRSALLERVDEAIAAAGQTGQAGALLFCDLDGFKPVNDTHGHAVGDQVLAVVARRLESQVRAGDTAARFGGDEFVVVADGLGGAELADLVDRLRTAVAAPIDIDGAVVTVTMTVGQVAIDPARTDSPAALLQSADAAMYRLKR